MRYPAVSRVCAILACTVAAAMLIAPAAEAYMHHDGCKFGLRGQSPWDSAHDDDVHNSGVTIAAQDNGSTSFAGWSDHEFRYSNTHTGRLWWIRVQKSSYSYTVRVLGECSGNDGYPGASFTDWWSRA